MKMFFYLIIAILYKIFFYLIIVIVLYNNTNFLIDMKKLNKWYFALYVITLNFDLSNCFSPVLTLLAFE